VGYFVLRQLLRAAMALQAMILGCAMRAAT
jgi:hypothetical protein